MQLVFQGHAAHEANPDLDLACRSISEGLVIQPGPGARTARHCLVGGDLGAASRLGVVDERSQCHDTRTVADDVRVHGQKKHDPLLTLEHGRLTQKRADLSFAAVLPHCHWYTSHCFTRYLRWKDRNDGQASQKTTLP